MRSKFLIMLLLGLCMTFIVPQAVHSQAVLSLDDCIQLVLKNNSQYRNAQSRVGAAGAQVLGAYASIMPIMRASAGGSETRLGPLTREYNTPVYKTDADGRFALNEAGTPVVDRYVKTVNETEKQLNNNYNTSISFNQMIYDGGQWWNRIKQNKRTQNAREFDEESARITAIMNVKRDYYDLLRNQQLMIVRQEDVRLAEEQLKSAQSRYEIGVAAQIDVFRSRVQRNTSKINLFSQKNSVEIAKGNLNTVMGRDPNEPVMILEDSTLEALTMSLDNALERALDGHPNIKSRREEIESARYGYKSAKAGLLPTLSASVSYSRFNPKFERVYSFIDRNYAWNYSLNLSIPLFDGLQTKSNIENASYNREIAEENLIDTKRTVAREVRQYYIALEMYLEESGMRKENLAEAEENLRLARERYNVGAGTLLEMIDAQVSLTAARIQYVSAIYNAKINEAQLTGALGEESLSDF